MVIKPGKYIHFKGKEYEVIGTATHSETLEELVVYRTLYGSEGLWVRPAAMWNGMIEQDGHLVRRFVHIDDIVPGMSEPVAPETSETPAGVHNGSTPSAKIELFMSLFTGRDDVFAKRWENAKKGIDGYAPVCHNEWLPMCPKSGGGKMKCGDCLHQNFAAYDTLKVGQPVLKSPPDSSPIFPNTIYLWKLPLLPIWLT